MRHNGSWRDAPTNARRLVLLVGAGLLTAGIGGGVMAERATAPRAGSALASASASASGRFAICGGARRVNCVVDGDTFWIAGEKIRIADIDTPETHPARCASEAALGGRATRRLQALLNGGPVTMAIGDRATDRYGRKLRIVSRNGVSVGDTLIEEGLARPWTGRRLPWCA